MLAAAVARQAVRARLNAAAIRAALAAWAALDRNDISGSYAQVVAPAALRALLPLQMLSAVSAPAFIGDALTEQNLEAPASAMLAPRSLVGTASDGRSLVTLLQAPLLHTLGQIGAGRSVDQASASGAASLSRIMVTQVADAGRDAESISMAARPAVKGYVRMLNLPSCSRCAVLAGRFYGWSAGFQRHEQCDCYHLPTTRENAHGMGGLAVDTKRAILSGRVTGLSGADLRAIVFDGADPARVINATRGLSTADAYGQRLKVTTEAARPGQQRLRPESIYQHATDREDAIRLLKHYGYLL